MANSIEDLKAKIDGLDVWDHIESASKIGFSAVNQELVPLFKWYGIYAQKPKEDGYFMLRIKIPGGILTSKQAETLSELAEKFALGVIDITTRQAVQMHWIRIENIPEILNTLKQVGMDTAGGCGDILRNVTGCPLAGLTSDEVFDASDDLKKIDSFFVRNRDFSNLPRKYKMSVTGCKTWCSQPDINCVSLVGVKHSTREEFGYTLKVGGGLSTKPIIAKNFPVFIPQKKALETIIAVTTVYRDNGFRDKRHHSRLKFLVEDWGVEKFTQAVETVLGYKLEKVTALKTMKTGAVEYFPSPETSHHDHLGITKLKNGLYAVGIAFTSGRTKCPDLKNIAQLAESFSVNGEIRTTNKQNLIITNIPEANLNKVLETAQGMGLKTQYSPFTKLGVACTGTEFCNLAIVETKAKASEIFEYLNFQFPNFDEELMISVTGCPNNCAQYSVADIGLVGCKTKDENGNMQDAFRIFLGGRLGNEAQFGKALDGRFLHQHIHRDLEKILNFYIETKKPKENFRNFIDRNGIENLQKVFQ
jgi:ferredoxin-nitrite reductase